MVLKAVVSPANANAVARIRKRAQADMDRFMDAETALLRQLASLRTQYGAQVQAHIKKLAVETGMPYAEAQILVENHLYRSTGTPARGKLAAAQAVQIRTRLAAGETGTALALEFGVSMMAISRIKNDKTYRRK